MIFSRVLSFVWLLAVSFAAATKNVKFREKTKIYPKKVRMIPFHQQIKSGFPDPEKLNHISKYNRALKVAGIDNAAINKIWTLSKVNHIKGHWVVGGYIANSVLFLAYFRIPAETASFDSEAFEESFLFVRHKPGLAFKWLHHRSRSGYFLEQVDTSQIDRNTCTSVYKILGRPGHVISLDMVVLGVEKDMFFATEWAKTRDLAALVPLALQLVRVKQGSKSLLMAPESYTVQPFGQPAAGTSTLAPLYAAMPITALESVASKIDPKRGNFQINGYFRALKEHHTYILSSKVPIEVRIYTMAYVHTLVAYEGRASRITLKLNPNSLHNIKIKGKFSDGDVAGFTLQVQRKGRINHPYNVELAAVSGEEMWPDAFQGEWSDYDKNESSDKYENEQLEDSEVESSYEQESEQSDDSEFDQPFDFENELSDDSGTDRSYGYDSD